MKVVSREEMLAIEQYDISSGRLNENDIVLSVAMSLEAKVIAEYPDAVTILCGNGRNGLYGLMLAELLSRDSVIDVTVISSRPVYSESCRSVRPDNLREIKQIIARSSYIVDCIYGIEEGNMDEYPFNYWIEWVNQSEARILSCDIPSGIDADNGDVNGNAVKASETMCIELPKRGLYIYPGNSCSGKICIEQVGYSYDAINSTETIMNTCTYRDVTSMLPNRTAHSHKGTYGKVLFIGGSDNFVGACVLCSTMILKAGAGLLTVMSYHEVVRTLHERLPEAMTITIDQDNLKNQLEMLDIDSYSLIVMGPGAGRSENTELLMKYVLSTNKPVILDADGLFYLKKHLDLLYRNAVTVITPHIGEYDRVFGFKQNRVIDDLVEITEKYSTLTVVLKSENTLIASKGKVTVNRTGNNALAKGGSGDVLCGLISGLYRQKPELESLLAAVFIHSLAADYWLQDNSAYSLLASDLINQIDKVIFELNRGKR